MPVIAMTREMGTRGKDVASGVAERLGLKVIHHEIVEKAVAERLNMSEGSVHRFLEGESSLWERWKIDRHRLSRYTAEEILELAAGGNVIIRGWGAAQLLAPVPHVLRVRVCAPMSARITEMKRRLAMDDSEIARAEIMRSDTAHARVIQSRFNSDWQDATGYALVLNTAALPIETCVNVICELATEPAYIETPESRTRLNDVLITERVRILVEDHGNLGAMAGTMKITSDRGRVRLECLVTSSLDIEALIQQVKSVPGVVSVINQVRSIPLSYTSFGP